MPCCESCSTWREWSAGRATSAGICAVCFVNFMILNGQVDAFAAGSLESLVVVLRREANGEVLAREPVMSADLVDVTSEAWRDGCLRRGQPQVPLAALPVRLVPTFKEGSNRRCAGFELEVTNPGGQPTRRPFTIYSLTPVAQRAAARLLAAGTLRPGQSYVYEVELEAHPRPVSPPAAIGSFETSVKSPPLSYLRVPLRSLLAAATAVDVIEDDRFPVFYVEAAFARAEKFSRRGAAAVPPVETGGVLIGSLCACEDSGEFFCVVTDVLEVRGAEEKEFSLSYSSQSWTRIQAIMKARQAAQPQRAERILGQAHGHNFVPNQGKICEACAHRPVCSLNNVFVSQEDQDWTRAVFARQPWQLCHIFGLTARGDRVHSLFGLQDGRLQSRGFFTIPDFNPEPSPGATSNLEDTIHAQT